MSKIALNGVAIRQAVIDGRLNAKTDQEIYNELSQQYYDKQGLAVTITSIPTEADLAKYGVYNNILLGILALSIVFKFLTVFSLTLQAGQPLLLLLIFVVPLFTLYFIYLIKNYNAFAYRACGFLAIAGLLQAVQKTDNAFDLILNIIFAGSICFLAFYLDKNLFPKYSPGKLKKDSNGEYILN